MTELLVTTILSVATRDFSLVLAHAPDTRKHEPRGAACSGTPSSCLVPAGLLVTALSGCTALFGSTLPDPYLPEHLSPIEPETAPLGTVTRALERPRHLAIDLAAALELAGGRSPEVELARVKELEAENVSFAECFSLLPGVTPLFRAFTHDGQAQPQTGINVYVTRTNFLAQPVIAARWWPGPVAFNLLAAARREDAARAGTAVARQNVQLSAALGYFELVRKPGLREDRDEGARRGRGAGALRGAAPGEGRRAYALASSGRRPSSPEYAARTSRSRRARSRPRRRASRASSSSSPRWSSSRARSSRSP